MCFQKKPFPLYMRLLGKAILPPVILGMGIFAFPRAGMPQSVIPLETLILEISVKVTDRYDPKSLPATITQPDNRPLPFAEGEMKSLLRSISYVERKDAGGFGEPQPVFAETVLGRLAPVLWNVFQSIKKKEVIFFQVWGNTKTTGMVFLAGEKLYWRFGLVNGLPYANSRDIPGQWDLEAEHTFNWQLVSKEEKAPRESSRFLVTDLRNFNVAGGWHPDSVSTEKRFTYIISTEKREEADNPDFQQIHGKVRWRKRSAENREEAILAKLLTAKGPEAIKAGEVVTGPLEKKEEKIAAPREEYPALREHVAEKASEEAKPFGMESFDLEQSPPPERREEVVMAKASGTKVPRSTTGLAKEPEKMHEGKKNGLLEKYYEIKKLKGEKAITEEEYQRRRRALIRGEEPSDAPQNILVAANTPQEEFSRPYKESKDESYKDYPDPLEGFNRTMFRFNDFFYENLMKPVATVYSEVTDEDFRSIVGNFFRNLSMPVRLVSCLIQGEGEKAGRTLTRFVVNTAFSGGLVDVAKTEFGIKEVDENFDQALGRHGVGTGSYVVWPVAGPSTVRGTFGMVVDTLLKPFWFLGIGTVNYTSVGGGERVNDTALTLGMKEEIDDMAIDPYLSVRDLYFQHNKGTVKE